MRAAGGGVRQRARFLVAEQMREIGVARSASCSNRKGAIPRRSGRGRHFLAALDPEAVMLVRRPTTCPRPRSVCRRGQRAAAMVGEGRWPLRHRARAPETGYGYIRRGRRRRRRGLYQVAASLKSPDRATAEGFCRRRLRLETAACYVPAPPLPGPNEPLRPEIAERPKRQVRLGYPRPRFLRCTKLVRGLPVRQIGLAS